MKATFQIRPVGIVRSRFEEQQGTPIQSVMAEAESGVIEIFPEFQAGLADLDGFSRIWVIYLFDRVSSESLSVIPYLDKTERGVFATRSPGRPNRLGMSSILLHEIRDGRVLFSGLDMLNGTPVIDLKPYIPDFDRHEVENTGWYPKSLRKKEPVLADNRFAAGCPDLMMEAVHGRVIATCISERVGTSKKPVCRCIFKSGQGISGDGHSGTVRQVSILMSEDIDDYNSGHVPHAGPGDFAENIVTLGIDLTKSEIGDRFAIGDAILEVTQLGKPVLPHHYSFHGNRLLPTRGVFCRVVKDGEAIPGDCITLLPKAG